MDEQKGCQFCYYEYFDGKAYPCSMCIRGEERTDKFEPKGRQTKQTDFKACELDGKADACKICRVSNYEPQ